MSTYRADVVVVGAGPAGSAVGAGLAGRGRDVLIVDRASFPRAKPCGECVNPGGVRALERMGLWDAVERTEPVPLGGWELCTRGGRGAWAGFQEGIVGWGVDRATFDVALLSEARGRGARILEGVRVDSVDHGGAFDPAVALGARRDGRPVRVVASVLVGADGLRSVVARAIGALKRGPKLRKASLSWRVRGSGPERDRGRLLLGGETTVGLAPVPSFDGAEDWNATLVVGTQRKSRNLRRHGWDLLGEGLRELTGAWREGPVPLGTPLASGPFDWPVRSPRKGRVLLVGDAAGYYDPLTGQGIYRALRSAELAVEAIDRGLSADGACVRSGGSAMPELLEARLAGYQGALRHAFAGGVESQKAIEAVLHRRWLREGSIGLLSRASWAGGFLARVVGDVRRDRA